jgi:hypothetical protein
VTLVESPGCHFCADARAVLAELATRGQLVLDVVDAYGPVGRGLLQRHRPPMLPLVLVDGRPFSHGRLPRRKLAEQLAAGRTTAAVG